MGSVVKKTHVKLESCGDDLRVFTLGPVQSLWHTRKEGGAGNPVDSTVASSPTLPAAAHCVYSQQLSLSLSAYPGLLAASQTTLGVSTDTSCTRRHTAKAACRSSSSISSYTSRATPLCGKRRAGWRKLGFLPESCVV